jgi:hypothetical protein
VGRSKRHWWLGLGVVAGVGCAYLLAKARRAARETGSPFEGQVCTDSQQLVQAFGALWRDPGLLRALFLDLQIDRQLAQKLALVVAGAVGWSSPDIFARHAALTDGLDRDQVLSLLRGELGQASASEAPALVYALRLCEAQGLSDPDLEARLGEAYGERQAAALAAFVSSVRVAALVGVALDALVNRLLGRPAPRSSAAEELRTLALFFLGVIPLTPVLVLRASIARA